MANVSEIKFQLEKLVDDLEKLEESLEKVETKIDENIQRLLQEELREREEKKLKYEIDDLQKEETKYEEKICATRLQILQARQTLRSALFGKVEQQEKKVLSSILSSTSFLKKTSSNPNIPITQNQQQLSSSTEEALDQFLLSTKEIEYDPKDKLGSGAFGYTFKGKLRGKDVAIKKLIHQNFNEDVLTAFKKEISIMAKLRHPNVLLFIGACLSPGNLAIVSELMPKGSLYDVLHSSTLKIPFITRMQFAKDTALGMSWLHGCNPPFLHLDLKTQNLLVDDHWTVKVADFGLSRLKKEGMKGKAGSPAYMSPEMLMDQSFDEKSDVYSFGIVLYELYTQQDPYKDQFKSLDDLMEGVVRKGIRPQLPADCPAKLKQLIDQCVNPLPANRPSFAQILKSKVLGNKMLFNMTDYEDDVIIEGVVTEKNQLGREMWKSNFFEKVHVTWAEFLPAFFKTLGVALPKDPEDIALECLKSLLTRSEGPDKQRVFLEDFGKMLEWFGPLEKGSGILSRIEAQLRMKGFFGDIETADAEKILNGKKKGSYLIRFSTRDPGCYAITSLTKQETLKHYRISHKAGGPYVLGTVESPSLEVLIKNHKKDLYLKNPLVGSKYESMFVAYDKKLATMGYTMDG